MNPTRAGLEWQSCGRVFEKRGSEQFNSLENEQTWRKNLFVGAMQVGGKGGRGVPIMHHVEFFNEITNHGEHF